jgi:hypothetical protein
LTLFVLGVFADNANYAAAVDDFALIANLLDGRADLHKTPVKQPLALNRWFDPLECQRSFDSMFQLEAKS